MAVNWVVFHLTDRCHLDCLHCLRDPGKRPLDLSPELVARVVGRARQAYGCGHVGLTGGEPVLHPRLGEVVDAIVAAGCTWHLVTSGGRFERLTALLAADPRRRKALTAVNFSVDGPREEVHDAIRGPGSFREVMAAVARCQAEELKFSLQFVLNARNAATLEEMGLAAAHLGASQLMVAMCQPTGTPRDAELFLPRSEWASLRDRAQRLAADLKLPVSLAEGFPEEQRFHVCHPHRSETLHVDPHGRLSLCCQLSGTPGEDVDVVADLAEVDLVEAHGRLLALVQERQRLRLAQIAAGPGGAWDAFPCNVCLESFGKPHWTDGGAAGPGALRPRFGTEVRWRTPGQGPGKPPDPATGKPR